jgi:capsular exopolysaccharide synthesis family protein
LHRLAWGRIEATLARSTRARTTPALSVTPRPGPAGAPHAPRGPIDRAQDSLSLRTLLALLLRRKWLILAVAATVLAVATLQVLTTTTLHRVAGTIQIDPEEPAGLPAADVAGAGYASRQAREEYVWTQAENLRNRELAERVVQRLGLPDSRTFNAPVKTGAFTDAAGAAYRALGRLFGRHEPPPQAVGSAADRLLSALDVRVRQETRLVDIAFTSPDPELAAQVVAALFAEYIERHFESRHEATVKATEFMRKQLRDMKLKIEEAEAGVVRYAQENAIVNLNDRETVSLQKLRLLNEEMTHVESELAKHTAYFAVAEHATPDAFPPVLASDGIRDLEQRRGDIERRLAPLLSRHGPAWPAVEELQSELHAVDAQLVAAKGDAIEVAKRNYELALSRRRHLAAEVDQQRRAVEQLNEKSIQYKILDDEVNANKVLYENLLQRIEEASVSAGLRSSNIRVVDRADGSRATVTPRRPLVLGLALIVGLLLGLAAAVVTESWDTALKSDDEAVRYLGLPALGVIPELPRRRSPRPRSGGLPDADATRDAGLPPLVVQEGTEPVHRRAWEAYRLVRTSLLLSHVDTPPQVIAVTSAVQGEGKTTTSCNVALAFAQTGERTLLVDLDLRRLQLSRVFDVSREDGVSTALARKESFQDHVRSTSFPNLHVLPAGPPTPNPPEFIGAEALRAELTALRKLFRYVVIDTPPCLLFSDALAIAPDVDGVVLVLDARRTPREAVRRASEQLASVGAEVLGCIVNRADDRGASLGRDYDYYAYRAAPAGQGSDRTGAAGTSGG